MTHKLLNAPPRRNLPVTTQGKKSEFWTSGADGALRISRCQDCHLWIHPHVDGCRNCHSRNIETEAVSGRGTVEACTINRQPWWKELSEPFSVAIVTLDEQPGLNITTNIVNCAPETVEIGMRVKVVFENIEDIWLPLFEPATD